MPKSVQEVRRQLSLHGLSVADWCLMMGVSEGLTRQILLGQRACVRGKSLEIAKLLGLKGSGRLSVRRRVARAS